MSKQCYLVLEIDGCSNYPTKVFMCKDLALLYKRDADFECVIVELPFDDTDSFKKLGDR